MDGSPKLASESFTIVTAQTMRLFSRVVGGAVTLVAAASQFGLFSFVPKEYEKQVSMGVVAVGLIAIMAGNEKQGSAIIQDRMSKPDIFTERGKPGRNQEDAKSVAYLSPVESQLLEKAKTGQLIPVEHLNEARAITGRVADIAKTAQQAIAIAPAAVAMASVADKARVLEEGWKAPV
jgi:hypothetical protein